MIVATALYGISMVAWFLAGLLRGKTLQKVGLFFLCAGFFVQTGLLIRFGIENGFLPFFDLAGNLSFCALVFAFIFILLYAIRRVGITGFFTAVVVTGLCLASLFLASEPAEPKALYKSIWIVLHVACLCAGNAAFTQAFALGVLYLLLERRIKEKRKDLLLTRLPSLDLLDGAGHFCILLGFVLITTGLILGFIFARIAWGSFWSWDPKEVWSFIVWLVYAVLLHGRLSSEWRGRKAAKMAILGFCLVVFAFFGVNFLFTGHHGDFIQIP